MKKGRKKSRNTDPESILLLLKSQTPSYIPRMDIVPLLINEAVGISLVDEDECWKSTRKEYTH